MSQFISDLTKKIRDNGIKVTQDETKIIITEFVNLIFINVLEKGEEVKIKNFANFFPSLSDKRKNPDGVECEQKEIIKVKLSKNFKNKS